MLSCALPYIKQDGYHITANINKRTYEVLKYDPNIDRFILHEDDSVPNEELPAHWEKLSKGYDKVVNFTGVIEDSILFSYPQPMYYWCLAKRRRHNAGINYLEAHIHRAGYTPKRPIRTRIYLSRRERKQSLRLRQHYKGKFLIMWALCGSSINKVYKHWEEVTREFLDRHSDAYVIASGDELTKMLHFDHPRVKFILPSQHPFRYTMSIIPMMDLVIGPETAALNVAGCYDVPKICLLTHSNKTNLTKYWKNDYSIQSLSYCSPCYLIHRFRAIWRNVCQVDPETGFPECCTVGFPPDIILNRMELVYNRWRKHGYQRRTRKRYTEEKNALSA